MLRAIIISLFFFTTTYVFAQDDNHASPANMQTFIQATEECQDLDCVRKNIDIIDTEIVVLLGRRLAYVKRAGELKGLGIPVHDQSREMKIYAKVGQEAALIGYSPAIARAVFTTILMQSNFFEQNFTGTQTH